MKQLNRYSPEHWQIDRTGTISPEQAARAQKLFEAKTARANCHTALKTDNNKLFFVVYGSKKVNLTYNETKYIFNPSGVLSVAKYDARTNRTQIDYFIY